MKKKNLLLPLTTIALALTMGLAACTGGQGGESKGGDDSQATSVQPSSQKQEKISITAADNKTSLYLDETVQLTADKDGVTWASKKEDVATVSASGLVTAVGEGSATITASKDGFTAGTITIKVQLVPIKVTAADSKTTLVIEETVQLSADKDGVTWASSDAAVASVSATGLVTALKAGSATITASKDKHKAGTITITVTRPAATATLHMEDADHFAADGEWSNSGRGPIDTPVYSKSNASDGTCLAYFGDGDIETLKFNSDKAVKAEICLMIGYYYSIDDASASFDVKFNKAAITLPAGQPYESEGTSDYTYKPVSFGDLDILKGENVLEITMKEGAQYHPYIDDLLIYAAEPATITVVKAAEKDPVVVKSESLTVAEGKTVQIESDMTGLSYKSASTSVATVSETGLVTGVAAGTTTITVSKDGFKSIRVAIEVTEAEGVVKFGVQSGTGEGITTRTSQNLSEPYNYIIDEFPANAVLSFEFEASKAGTYSLYMKARASGGYSSTTTDDLATCMELSINGAKLTLSGTVEGSFTEYLLGDVTLNAGKNTLTIKCLTTVPTMNTFKFIPKA